MKIVMADGREFVGTPKAIMQSMRAIAFGAPQGALCDYVDWVIAQTQSLEGLALHVPDGGEDERCAALVEQLVRYGLARRR
jgi:hypothetical protein